MEIKREIQLMNFIEKNLGRPFAWGECDCNTFALEAVDAVFDTSLAEKIKGQYFTELGALMYRKKSRWGTFINLLKETGFIEVAKGFEQTGDLLIVEDPRWEMVHISLGSKVMSSLPGAGVQYFSASVMKGQPYSVWRFGCLP